MLRKIVLGFPFLFLSVALFGQNQTVWLHPNDGQWDDRILFKVDASFGGVNIVKNGFTYLIAEQHKHSEGVGSKVHTDQFQVIKSTFTGSSWKGEQYSNHSSDFYRNYYLGKDQSKWRSKVYSYRETCLKEFYVGIDMLIDGKDGNLKYSLSVAPQVDPSVIEYTIEGSEKLFVDEKGRLHIRTISGDLIEDAPMAWTESSKGKKEVPVRFVVNGNRISFEFPKEYDKTQKLVIDPSLVFSSFTGSSSDNWGMTACPDNEGNLFAGGIAFGDLGTYPTTVGVFDGSYNGGTVGTFVAGFDAVISKFNSNGTALLYSTYLGGSGNEVPHSMVTNESGELFIFGVTSSSDFPVTTNAFDNSFGNGFTITETELTFQGSDIYISHFAADGSALIGATYVGGIANDGINSGELNYNYGDSFRGEIIVDDNGSVYVTSSTTSTDFPLQNAAQGTLSGTQDAVIFKMDESLSTMVWSTYFGGSGKESGNSVQLASNGDLYVTGGTTSANLLVTGGEDVSFGGGTSDGFVARFNGVTGQYMNGTYIGDNEYDQSYFVQLDGNNEVYVYGQSQTGFTISNGVYGNANSGQFIRKYASDLGSVLWTTMIGAGTGNIEISPTAFLVSECMEIYLAGWGGQINQMYSQALSSTTNGFSTTPDAYQTTTNGSNFYIAVLTKNAVDLKYATFMGGDNSSFNHVDGGTSRFDKSGRIYHAVCAACGGVQNGFTTTSGVYAPSNGSTNCNLAAFKFDLGTILAAAVPPIGVLCAPDSVVFTNQSSNSNEYQWDFGDGTTSTEESPTHYYSNGGTYQVQMIAMDSTGCIPSDTSEVEVNLGSFSPGVVQPPVICKDSSYHLDAFGGTSYLWSPEIYLDDETLANPLAKVDENTTFTVVITDSCGVDTLTVQLNVIQYCDGISVDPPNVFTPNKDGGNDLYFMNTLNVKSLNLKIYNRWGGVLFDETGEAPAWNGKSKDGGDVSDGVYFYTYKAEGFYGETAEGHGFLHLIRDSK